MSETLQHAPASGKPAFQQMLSRKRPHTLLTQDQTATCALVYRYLDTGETATVPNVWYNQPPALRMMGHAEQVERYAKKLEVNPAKNLTPAENQKLIEQYRQRAQAFRDTAEKLKTGEQG